MSKEKSNIPELPPIDMSKLANMEAVKLTDPELVKNIQDSRPPSMKRSSSTHFRFNEPELVPLPSKGRFYQSVTKDPDILNGNIRIYPMTVKEEEILSTPRFLKTGSATRMLFSNCIASDIDAGDILIFDSNMLLFLLRQVSYGDDYKFTLKCKNTFCEKEFTHTVKISNLSFDTIPDTVVEPIIVNFPSCKYTASLILPRLCHSEEIFLRASKRKKGSTDSDQRMSDNLVITTTSIKDKNGKEVPQSLWDEFYQSLIGKDRAYLTEKTTIENSFDRINGIFCPYCEKEFEGGIPIGVEFFLF